MKKREIILWQILVAISCIAILVNIYILYNMNGTIAKLQNNFNNEEIGTDKNLQNKVERLESSLIEKKEFKFKMKDNPSDLSSVIDFDGFESMGMYKHFKLENIWFSKRRNKYMAELKTEIGTNYYTINDTISGGIIIDIFEKSLKFMKDNEEFIYEVGENNNEN